MTITNGYTTLVKVKALADITSTDATDDGYLEDLITQASRVIDNVTGRTFYARTETHYYDMPFSRELLVKDDDLLTVTSLTNGDGAVIPAAQYDLLPRNVSPKWAVRLKETSAYSWVSTSAGNIEGAITIAGTWGYSATTPADIESACNEIVVAAYHRRSGQNVTDTTITSGGVVITPQGIPASARAILSRYIKRL